MDPVPPRRTQMEARYGPVGSGERELTVAGQRLGLPEILTRLGLGFEECRALDGLALGPDRFMVRYYDAQEQWVVAYEFDAAFGYRGESRAHVAEWIGEAGLALGGIPDAIETSWISR